MSSPEKKPKRYRIVKVEKTLAEQARLINTFGTSFEKFSFELSMSTKKFAESLNETMRRLDYELLRGMQNTKKGPNKK